MIRKQDITSFNAQADAIIWDVRDKSNYQDGHIQGAKNYPIDSLNVDSLNDVAKDQPIYILCGGGSKAPRAAELLEGLDDAREYVVLMGGTRAAKEAGWTLQQGD
ncbi:MULTISPECIES: rhodanese-like domain-containing protein [unclassified Acinetobacter]|uniref:rhodanese-like domain-containing protein n=1 Tax=unclassified Acinetobacter TaxID=196816 RepID=UPI0035B9BE6F